MSMPHHVEGGRPTVSTEKHGRKLIDSPSLGTTRVVLKPIYFGFQN